MSLKPLKRPVRDFKKGSRYNSFHSGIDGGFEPIGDGDLHSRRLNRSDETKRDTKGVKLGTPVSRLSELQELLENLDRIDIVGGYRVSQFEAVIGNVKSVADALREMTLILDDWLLAMKENPEYFLQNAEEFLYWSLFADVTTQHFFTENDIHKLLPLPDDNPFWQIPLQLRSNIVDFLKYAHNVLSPQESSRLLYRFRERGLLNTILFQAIEGANSQPIDKLSVYNYLLTGNDYYRYTYSRKEQIWQGVHSAFLEVFGGAIEGDEVPIGIDNLKELIDKIVGLKGTMLVEIERSDAFSITKKTLSSRLNGQSEELLALALDYVRRGHGAFRREDIDLFVRSILEYIENGQFTQNIDKRVALLLEFIENANSETDAFRFYWWLVSKYRDYYNTPGYYNNSLYLSRNNNSDPYIKIRRAALLRSWELIEKGFCGLAITDTERIRVLGGLIDNFGEFDHDIRTRIIELFIEEIQRQGKILFADTVEEGFHAMSREYVMVDRFVKAVDKFFSNERDKIEAIAMFGRLVELFDVTESRYFHYWLYKVLLEHVDIFGDMTPQNRQKRIKEIFRGESNFFRKLIEYHLTLHYIDDLTPSDRNRVIRKLFDFAKTIDRFMPSPYKRIDSWVAKDTRFAEKIGFYRSLLQAIDGENGSIEDEKLTSVFSGIFDYFIKVIEDNRYRSIDGKLRVAPIDGLDESLLEVMREKLRYFPEEERNRIEWVINSIVF